jgi:adenosylmethionine-8-amino-7-oxononanoate aminotransferase
MKASDQSLSSRDRAVLWHPYTQHATEGEALPVVSAQGAYLQLADGRKILDAISSWWVNLHGHAHPEIAAAVAAQAGMLEQVIFAGFTHEPAVALAETLTGVARAAGAPVSRAFYSDNGSTAVEVALKMAFQFHLNRGDAGRVRFIALQNGYHGDTLGAMAVGEPEGFHPQFRRLLPPVDFIPVDDLAALDHLLKERPGQHAAFIFEPMIQGAGGMKTYSAEFLRGAAQRCIAAGIPLIADEVFTGFFRTGKCFAFEHAGISPDLICLSKGVTGGFMPLGVTLATEEIFSAFLHDDKAKAFLHGHSFTGSPLACAAALKSWEILQRAETQARIKMIAQRTATHLAALAKRPAIAATRQLGTIGAIEITEPSGRANYFSAIGPVLRSAALARGVLLRPLGNVLYAVPPYCVTEAEVDRIYETMGDILDALET